MARPLEMAARLGWYILKAKLSGRKRFPLVTMLEPLEKCNLACEGCGRIREYEPVLDRMATVDRNVLRVALYELRAGSNVPPKVAINEAVELAKEFGGETSGRFVNGVLGSALEAREA